MKHGIRYVVRSVGGLVLLGVVAGCTSHRSLGLNRDWKDDDSFQARSDRGDVRVYLAPGFEVFSKEVDDGFDALLKASEIFEYAISNNQSHLQQQRRMAANLTGGFDAAKGGAAGTDSEAEGDAAAPSPFADEKRFPNQPPGFPESAAGASALAPAYHEALEYTHSVLNLGRMLRNRYDFVLREELLKGNADEKLIVIPGEVSIRPGRRTRQNYEVSTRISLDPCFPEENELFIIAVSPHGLSNFMLESTKVVRSLSATALLAGVGGGETGSVELKALLDAYRDLQESLVESEYLANITGRNEIEILYSGRSSGNGGNRLSAKNYKFEVFAVSKTSLKKEVAAIRQEAVNDFLKMILKIPSPEKGMDPASEARSTFDRDTMAGRKFSAVRISYDWNGYWLPRKSIWNGCGDKSNYGFSSGCSGRRTLVHLAENPEDKPPAFSSLESVRKGDRHVVAKGSNLIEAHWEVFVDGMKDCGARSISESNKQVLIRLSNPLEHGDEVVVVGSKEKWSGHQRIRVGPAPSISASIHSATLTQSKGGLDVSVSAVVRDGGADPKLAVFVGSREVESLMVSVSTAQSNRYFLAGRVEGAQFARDEKDKAAPVVDVLLKAESGKVLSVKTVPVR